MWVVVGLRTGVDNLRENFVKVRNFDKVNYTVCHPEARRITLETPQR